MVQLEPTTPPGKRCTPGKIVGPDAHYSSVFAPGDLQHLRLHPGDNSKEEVPEELHGAPRFDKVGEPCEPPLNLRKRDLDSPWGNQSLGFGAHHKTGGNFYSVNFRLKFAGYFDSHWTGDYPERLTRIVHALRSPVNAIVSGYLYHRRGQERGDDRRAERVREEALQLGVALPDFLPGEPYEDYLARLPENEGILAEAIRYLAMEAPEVMVAHKALLQLVPSSLSIRKPTLSKFKTYVQALPKVSGKPNSK